MTTNKPIGTKIPRPRREESRSRRPLRRSSTREVTAKMRKTRAENLMIWCLIDVWGKYLRRRELSCRESWSISVSSWPETTPPRSGVYFWKVFVGLKRQTLRPILWLLQTPANFPWFIAKWKSHRVTNNFTKKKGRNFSIMNFILAQGNANLLCYVPIVETWCSYSHICYWQAIGYQPLWLLVTQIYGKIGWQLRK